MSRRLIVLPVIINYCLVVIVPTIVMVMKPLPVDAASADDGAASGDDIVATVVSITDDPIVASNHLWQNQGDGLADNDVNDMDRYGRYSNHENRDIFTFTDYGAEYQLKTLR